MDNTARTVAILLSIDNIELYFIMTMENIAHLAMRIMENIEHF